MRRLAGPFSAGSEVDTTLRDLAAGDDARAARCCPPTRQPLKVQAQVTGGHEVECCDGGSGSDGSQACCSGGSGGGASPAGHAESQLRAQLTNFNLLSSVLEHTSWK